jgi:hypothetical protein
MGNNNANSSKMFNIENPSVIKRVTFPYKIGGEQRSSIEEAFGLNWCVIYTKIIFLKANIGEVERRFCRLLFILSGYLFLFILLFFSLLMI